MSTSAVNTTEATLQQNRVRDTMSFSNILASPCPTAPSPEPAIDVAKCDSALTPPVTPVKNVDTVAKAEETATPAPDTQTSDPAHPQAADFFPEDDADDDADDLPDAERGFICKNDETSRCVTGQYTKDLSRKVISDHFGRNKACTRDISSWPLFCRKHYQRATYNKELWQIRKLNLIFRQFDIIDEEYPGTTYNITLKKSEAARLEKYCLMVMSGRSAEDAAKAVASVAGKHFEAPIEILRELYLDMGDDRTIEQVKEVVEKIYQQIVDGATKQVPSIEFLPNLGGNKGSPKKAPKTPTPKKTRSKGTPSSSGTPSRISTKGSVKKPSQKA